MSILSNYKKLPLVPQMPDYVTDWAEVPIMLTTKKTAKIIGYGTARVRELCKAGAIPNIRLGRAYMIPRDQLRLFIEQQAQLEK